MVVSGALLVIDATILLGGSITKTALTPSTNGWTVAVLSSVNQANAQNQFEIQAGGKLYTTSDAGGNFMGYIKQQTGWYWGVPTSVDLASGYCNFAVNASGGAVTFPSPTNIIPGVEMVIYAYVGNCIVPGAVMWDGNPVTVTGGTMKTFIGMGYPTANSLRVKT
jgi:hypothetical protein